MLLNPTWISSMPICLTWTAETRAYFRSRDRFSISLTNSHRKQMLKVATVAGLAIQSMNPDSEVDQMPPHRQTLDITNANAFLSHFQRTASRTLKFFAFDNPNQFFFAIFKSLMLKSANFLCTVKQCGRHFTSLVFVFRGKNYKANVGVFPSIQIFKAYFEANRGSKRRRTFCS